MDDEVRITLRLPASLRDRVSDAGKSSGRSLNAEIVQRLENSFASWPPIVWSKKDRATIDVMPSRITTNLEKEIQANAILSFKRMMRSNFRAANEMREAFEHLITDVHEDDRPRIEDEFDSLLLALGVDLKDDDDV